MKKNSGRVPTLLGLVPTLLGLTIGCSAPKGDNSGRIEVHQTTAAERGSGQMLISDLASACDKIAAALARDIARIVDQEFGGYRVTVMVGDIRNKTGTMSTSEFEFVRERIKNKLVNSRMVTDNVKFVAGRQRMQALNEREYDEESEDLLQEGEDDGFTVERPNREYAMFLNGDAFGIHRGSTKMFYVQFALHRASDGAEVFNNAYEQKYE